MRELRDLVKGLPPPLRPGEPIHDLHGLTVVGQDGVARKLVCPCGGMNWLKVGARFTCYACRTVTVTSDGSGWRSAT